MNSCLLHNPGGGHSNILVYTRASKKTRKKGYFFSDQNSQIFSKKGSF